MKQCGKNQPLKKNKIGDEKNFQNLMKKSKQWKNEKVRSKKYYISQHVLKNKRWIHGCGHHFKHQQYHTKEEENWHLHKMNREIKQ